MQTQETLPNDVAGLRGGLLVVECASGRARTDALREWTERLRADGTETLHLACDFRDGGVWAGVDQWVERLLPAIRRDAPGLLEAHAAELETVLPHRARRSPDAVNLTDAATGGEAVRNYAMDRAYRIPHGVIDLLDEWYAQAPPAPRVIVCEGFDRAGALCRRFFRELLRRRGERLGITLVLAVSSGSVELVRSEFGPRVPWARTRLDLPGDPSGLSPRAEAFARLVGKGLPAREFPPESRFPDLLRYWEEAGGPVEVLPWMAYALGRYNHYGFYEDALLFLEPVLAGIDSIPEVRDFLTRWNVVGAVFNCLIAVGQVERAHRVVLEEAHATITDPLDRARACYVTAMLHARFLPEKDFEAAERYIDEGLRQLEGVDPADENRDFLAVFLGNGLAFIRSRQGKPLEAIDLCVEGGERMRARMGTEKHRLHRSVLLYNIAQVYTATRENEKAVEYFTLAMEMDPNYSEYHNERGNVYLAMGRFDDAIRDYRDAIRLSAPFPEVWTNLGQCYRQMGRLEDAAAAYTRALDLDPSVELARVGRAQVFAGLDQTGRARRDYELTLAANPAQPLVLANLAALLYREGKVDHALARLDQAVELDPGNAALHRNRAIALEALGRPDEAARDLATYLSLVSDASDRASVEEKIAALSGSLAAV
jgi:tetratricopeptide (TPR) repeat protein